MEPEHISKHLPEIINRAPAKQESAQLKTSDEKSFAAAIQAKRLFETSREDLVTLLRFLMVKVGLRSQNVPTQEEFNVLVSHIYENFGGHTLPEIRLAFDMAIAGKLKLKDGANCFENFSCVYFSGVMNSYRFWAEQVPVDPPPPPPQKIYTEEEIWEIRREDVERQYQLFLGGHKLKSVEFNVPVLEKDGLLKEGQNVMDFFRETALAGFGNIYVKSK